MRRFNAIRSCSSCGINQLLCCLVTAIMICDRSRVMFLFVVVNEDL